MSVQPVMDDCERAWAALPQMLRGRGEWLQKRGRIKDAELMYGAATEIESLRQISARLAAELEATGGAA